ncbi:MULTISPECIES: hypothetical protein [unclassified Methanoregula]|uniref:hypothetical protein n=1 Tax=unclassified Methanoregula TaxID=2649730 RepID=UPI0009C85A0F|nr:MULTISPECIES: hypothetical protein [unclassified Methanoregula]OPX62206.1 MAG: hypothetical protein A4E33_02472 [Methanoregula sp. PtaB.Bin085]OPY35585.1 MAG: hypothetical protein A4E34_00585 [Methanoregula sp. PtaU1.Bin006]
MRISLSPQQFRELLLSHHPDLPAFRNDVIIINNRRICAGCLLGYPAALITLVLLRLSGFESILLALLLAIVSQLRKFSGNVAVQHFGRIVAGVALGFGLGGAWWALLNDEWVALLLLAAGAGLYLFIRVWSVQRELEKEFRKRDEKRSE